MAGFGAADRDSGLVFCVPELGFGLSPFVIGFSHGKKKHYSSDGGLVNEFKQ